MKNCNKAKCVVATLAVFAFIFVYEWVFHGQVMMGMYEATAQLWRPHNEMQEMGMWMMIHNFLLAMVFTCLYKKFQYSAGSCDTQEQKGKCCPYRSGICFGLKIGLIMGLLASKSYAWLPIPMSIALGWFAGSVVEGIGIGLVLSLIYKKKDCSAA